jgi:hypothetical protein
MVNYVKDHISFKGTPHSIIESVLAMNSINFHKALSHVFMIFSNDFYVKCK